MESELYPRFIENRVHIALNDTRVVLICGPRQSGKTTLVRQIAGESMPFFTLDDPIVFKSATIDPVGFVRDLDRAVIDEVHRVPDLILALKMTVDTDPSPGRFLLTGSANLFQLPKIADSLAGRMSTIHLFPLAQAELQKNESSFLERIFAGEMPKFAPPVVGSDLTRIVLAGGYPEALVRTTSKRRQDWQLDYVEAVVKHDVRDVARVDQLNSMPGLLRVLAEYSGQLVNYYSIGGKLNMNQVTTQRYVGILENLFIVRTLRPWFSNRLKRLIKSPKVHFLDSGLLASLRGISSEHLIGNRVLLGPMLESFVFSELLKLASWSRDRYEFSHFRDKEKNEVDIVIEDRRGRVVGIQVKASATVSSKDFSGMRHLATACGSKFILGLVLYDHDKILPFGDRMFAAPVSLLWA